MGLVRLRVCGQISYFCGIHTQAVFVPADDLTDPAPATTFAHLDATTVLSRAISELGIYPAVDPLDSSSRIMDANIVGEEHYNVARGTQKILQVCGREGCGGVGRCWARLPHECVGVWVDVRYGCEVCGWV